MRNLNYVLLAVRNPRESATVYTQLLGCTPVVNSETFVLYVLPTGLKVGLWLESEAEPKPKAPGGVELSFTEESREAVLQTHDAWKQLGLEVLQAPTDMPFGFTCVFEDLDGHRLRPFAPASNPR